LLGFNGQSPLPGQCSNESCRFWATQVDGLSGFLRFKGRLKANRVAVMLKDLKADIEKIVEAILQQEGFDLVEIKLSRYKKNYRLQIFADSDYGISIDDCAILSRLVGTALDMDDVMDNRYILEISSPGLDRPLQSDRDFKRKIGAAMAVDLIGDGREQTIRGTLTGIVNGMLVLIGEQGEIKIPLSDVRQGKIII
jgi:ribosome maturation factor RimP